MPAVAVAQEDWNWMGPVSCLCCLHIGLYGVLLPRAGSFSLAHARQVSLVSLKTS
jgi:hypothetical protein